MPSLPFTRSRIAALGFVALAVAACISTARPDLSSVPKHKPGNNPFAGHKLYVDPEMNAAKQAERWRVTRPADAALMDKIARQPQAEWLGEWSGAIKLFVKRKMLEYASAEAMGHFIVYNIPDRDCGQHSKGGAKTPEAYLKWIDNLAAGTGDQPAVLILEPDAIPLMEKCTSPAAQEARFRLISDALKILKARPNLIVYLDAGNARWVPAADMAERLQRGGLDYADGFSINVSNYVATDESMAYGKAISEHAGGAHFVIDTSRNGNGAAPGNAWCNPDGRALGIPPTTDTGDPRCDAFLWLKRPGESDGACNGGPRAGEWWPSAALGMASRSQY